MTHHIHLDFETQSRCDLLVHGADRYVKDPSTEVTTMAYAIGEEEPKIWYPGKPLPRDLLDHVNSNGELWAHNSSFEFQMWNSVCVPKYKFPPLKLEQTYCTMSMANAMGLMGSLDGAAQCAGLPIEKDKEGYRIMLVICKPKADGTFWTRKEWPEKFQLLDRYCIKDVEIERQLSKRLAPLSSEERKIWLLDQKINARGFQVDTSSAVKLDVFVEREKERLGKEFQYLTANQVPSPASHAKFKKWLAEQGVITDSIDKAAVAKILEGEAILGDIPAVAKRALLVRKEISKSSNAKIKMMLNLECEGRIRNGFEYYGAKQTGRWAGRKLQPHNFPRGNLKEKEINHIFKLLPEPKSLEKIEILYGNIMDVTSSLIRPLIISKPGHRLIVADLSNIEGRVAAWFAGEEWKLKAFRDFDAGIGDDLYRVAYSKSFRIDVKKVDDYQRQVGKTLELACQFQGAVGAFQTMAKTLGVKVEDPRAKELVDAWRNAHPKIKNYWYELEEAAVNAIQHPGTTYSVGPVGRSVIYVKKGSFLCCRLPSGRIIYYPYPKYEPVPAPWDKTKTKMSVTYMYQDSETKKWMRGPTYGGSLFENNTQGFSRDTFAHGLLAAEENNYPIVFHTHDEGGCEVPKGAQWSSKGLEKILATVPKWAPDLPLAAKGFESLRYRKG